MSRSFRTISFHTGFGKYFELLFDRFGTPKGGVVTNYLLEKSRTVKPGQGERNFHVFYQLVQGAPRDERSRLCLLDSAERVSFASVVYVCRRHRRSERI